MSGSRPNLLLITTDQQRWDTIQSLGNGLIRTPNLDFLADQGVSMTRCYTDCPISMPARATIMNGRHAFNHGMLDNGGDKDPIDPATSLPGLLTASGYQTRAVGKMHFPERRRHYGFEHMELLEDYYRYMQDHPSLGVPMAHGLGQNQMVPGISTVDESQSLTHWTVRRSIDFLETRDPTRPFFLWTSFAKPHPPLDPCRNYWELYRDRSMPTPAIGNWSQTIDQIPLPWREPTWILNGMDRYSPELIADVRRAYYALITQIDYNLGLLLARLRELGELDNTWILFTSDHGEMLGDHHLGAKTVPFEAAARVPMLIRPPHPDRLPTGIGPGHRSESLVCLADILPTLTGLGGVDTDRLGPCDGISLLDQMAGPVRELLHLQCKYYHGVVSRRSKLLFEEVGGSRLAFDVQADPYETDNLMTTEGPDPVLEQALIERLSSSGSRGVVEGRLVAGQPDRPVCQVPRSNWPGYHSTVVPTDVLH